MAGKKYVLLVDHHHLFAKAFRDRFLKNDPQVEMELADSANAALKHLGLKPCDLLIADLRLQEVDGLQLLLRVRQSYPHLTKVVMAANASPRDSQKAQDYGSVLYVEKPASPSDYDTAVGRIAGILAETPDIPRGALGDLKLDEMVSGGDEPPPSCVLVVYSETGTGLLHLHGGQIVHAQTPHNQGSDALKEMLSWQCGPFEKRSFQEPQKRTLDLPWKDIFTVWMEEKSDAPPPSPVMEKKEDISAPSRMPAAAPAVEPTVRIKRVLAPAAPSPSDVPLSAELIASIGLRFALRLDATGKVQQEVHCADTKFFIGVATFTAAKAKEVARQFQWNPPRSIHFVHDSVELAVLPFATKTILLGWTVGQDSMAEKINKVFGAGLLDPTSATTPRLPATIDAMKKIPGLHGYAIFNKDHQVVVKKFSAQWSLELLQNTARIIAQMCMVLQLQKLPVKLAQIKFDPGSIFTIPFDDLMLISICHQQAKVPLLKDCLSRITGDEIKKAVL